MGDHSWVWGEKTYDTYASFISFLRLNNYPMGLQRIEREHCAGGGPHQLPRRQIAHDLPPWKFVRDD